MLKYLAILTMVLFPGVAPGELSGPVSIFPAGGQVGTEFVLRMTGGSRTWPLSAWSSEEGVKITPTEEINTFQVRISEDARRGPCLVRFYSKTSVSPVWIFMVGLSPEMAKEAGHGSADQPQPVSSLPMTINGWLAPDQESDYYRFQLSEGSHDLSINVDSLGLRSPVESEIQLLDPVSLREVLPLRHPWNQDPFLSQRVRGPGELILRVGVRNHQENELPLNGVYRVRLKTELPHFDLPEDSAPEPEGTGPQRINWPVRMRGVLSHPGEIDRFLVSLEEGESVEIRVEGQELHLPVDPVIRIMSPDGKKLDEVDNSGGRLDPDYILTAPRRGTYVVEVWDQYRRGGGHMIYDQVIEQPKPHFCARLQSDQYVLRRGGAIEMKARLNRRNGHETPLALMVNGLPGGVTATAEDIPDQSGDFHVKLQASPDADLSSGPINLCLVESGSPDPVEKLVMYSLPTTGNKGSLLIDCHPHIWLTVLSGS